MTGSDSDDLDRNTVRQRSRDGMERVERSLHAAMAVVDRRNAECWPENMKHVEWPRLGQAAPLGREVGLGSRRMSENIRTDTSPARRLVLVIELDWWISHDLDGRVTWTVSDRIVLEQRET